MKYFKLLTCVSAMFLLAACAQTRTDLETRVGYVEKLNVAEGTHRPEIVRTVTWISRSACSVLDFVSIVTSQDTTIHDVINIRADEGKTSSDDGQVMGYSCKYWGIAVRYVPVNAPQVVRVAQPVQARPAQPIQARPAQPVPVQAPVQQAPVQVAPVRQEPPPATSSGPMGESFVPSVEALQK